MWLCALTQAARSAPLQRRWILRPADGRPPLAYRVYVETV